MDANENTENTMTSESECGVLKNIVRNYFTDNDVAAAREIEQLLTAVEKSGARRV